MFSACANTQSQARAPDSARRLHRTSDPPLLGPALIRALGLGAPQGGGPAGQQVVPRRGWAQPAAVCPCPSCVSTVSLDVLMQV